MQKWSKKYFGKHENLLSRINFFFCQKILHVYASNPFYRETIFSFGENFV